MMTGKLTIAMMVVMTIPAFALTPRTASATDNFPGAHWEVVDPSRAGCDAIAMAEAAALCDSAHVAALFAVRGGRVVLSYGTPERRLRLASARKSMLHAVIGFQLAAGRMDLDRTLAQMGIDDKTPLTNAEKQATLRDLTRARSGVYLPAAFEMRSNAESRPPRGSHAHGTFFYYNNWDFNVLSTIVEKEAGEPFFDTFAREIAAPLGFEDFDPIALHMRYEPDKSEHGAYLMRLSARDLARVGLLYLNDGAWRGNQIVDADWVRAAGERVSKMEGGFGTRGYYGHLWWAQDIAGESAYYASGAGGQRLFVVPSRDLVVVVLFDTFGRGGGRDRDIARIVETIVAAASGEPSSRPAGHPYQAPPTRQPAAAPLSDDIDAHVVGVYSNRQLGNFEIVEADGKYSVITAIGTFRLISTGSATGWVGDVEAAVTFSDDPDSDVRQFRVTLDDTGRMTSVHMTW